MGALDTGTVAALAVVALALSVILSVVCAVQFVALSRLRRQLRANFPSGAEDVVDVLLQHRTDIDELRDDVATVHGNTERLGERLKGSISRVGLVRYDAFGDVGGAQSFSVALLDRHSNGVVISAINGRTETRSYGKDIVAGDSQHTLSDEEREAIAAAVEGRPATMLTPPRRRRRAS